MILQFEEADFWNFDNTIAEFLRRGLKGFLASSEAIVCDSDLVDDINRILDLLSYEEFSSLPDKKVREVMDTLVKIWPSLWT